MVLEFRLRGFSRIEDPLGEKLRDSKVKRPVQPTPLQSTRAVESRDLNHKLKLSQIKIETYMKLSQKFQKG
jgi:hypothetical protein